MKPIRVKSIWKDKVSIRDNVWRLACDNEEGLTIKYKDETMQVSYDDIKYLTPRGRFVDKFKKNLIYSLVDIKWKPTANTNQRKLL